MVKKTEVELSWRRQGLVIEVAGGNQLLLHGQDALLDGVEVTLSRPRPLYCRHRSPTPGTSSPRTLFGLLASGIAKSEHAVEMAVARCVTPRSIVAENATGPGVAQARAGPQGWYPGR